MLRKVAVAAASKPHVEIRQDGDQFYIKTSTTVRTTEINFKVGEGFEEETVDGRKCRVRPQRRAAFRGPLLPAPIAAAGRAPASLCSRWRAFLARPCTGGLQRGFARAGFRGLGRGSSPARPHPTPSRRFRVHSCAWSGGGPGRRRRPQQARVRVRARGCGGWAAATSPVAGGAAALAPHSPSPLLGPQGTPRIQFQQSCGPAPLPPALSLVS